jgi:hypothetical protein
MSLPANVKAPTVPTTAARASGRTGTASMPPSRKATSGPRVNATAIHDVTGTRTGSESDVGATWDEKLDVATE